MKFTIFSTLCLGFSSAALAASESIEAIQELVESSIPNEEVAEPIVRLEARRNYPGTCNRNNHVCYFKWTEGARTGRSKCNCDNTPCSTNNGYCTYVAHEKTCLCG